MTEIQKEFYDDINEKKSIKNSANKKNRTGKGPIRFPSDYLTKKEKEQLNSECRSWTFSKFPDREAFDIMPEDIQIKYLNWIMNVYNVGITTISEHVFGQSKAALGLWLHRRPNISKYINKQLERGQRVKQSDLDRLISDVKKAREPEELIASPDFTEKEHNTPEDDNQFKSDNSDIPTIRSMEFSMDGFDMDFLSMIRDRFGDQKVHVCVSIYVEKYIYGEQS